VDPEKRAFQAVRRIGTSAVVAVAVCLAGAGAADAAPLKGFDWSSAAVKTDGVRYAAWPTTDGGTNVWDTRRGEKFVVRFPDGCTKEPLLGGGHLVWNCIKSDQGGDMWVFSLKNRSYARVPGANSLRGELGDPDIFTRVGTHWLLGAKHLHREWSSIYVRLHDGRVVEQETRSNQFADLDDVVAPVRRLCRRIRRPANPDFDPGNANLWEDLVPIQYERPFAATQEGHYPGGLVLRSCLGARPKVLARQMPIDWVQLGAGFVTWPRMPQAGRNGVANAYVARSRRHFRWTVFAPVAYIEVRHTANRIFVSEPRGGSSNPTWLLKSAPFNPR
jgi:hypothetical protein